MPRCTHTVLALLATLVIAGCGDDSSDEQRPDAGQEQTPEGGQATDEALNVTYKVAKRSCSEVPVKNSARAYGLPASASESDVAKEYAKLVEAGLDRESAFDGCLAGLAAAPP